MYSQPCRHYLAGYCRNGDNCPFIHSDPYKSHPSRVSYKRDAFWNPAVPRVCRFFLMGSCAYGNGCEFLHPRQRGSNDHSANHPARQGSAHLSAAPRTANTDLYHYRKPQDSKSTPSAPLGFSFKQTLEALKKSGKLEKLEDFGYQPDEIYSSRENLSSEDLDAYSKEGEGAFSYIPLLPPPEDLCL
ncbi:hypothetical protein Aperf_G00000080538 [Anoplocephala perfoliata]